ncbi:H-NS family nucleoid-associated regulatory protein [Thioclava kandeliae]|uniref:H-NS family nucleoid-associated regulatory protein n=1 Tax=Thioclava kandeliae TaxID=3070818 RepID=A0ABV1SMH2_9RHOB
MKKNDLKKLTIDELLDLQRNIDKSIIEKRIDDLNAFALHVIKDADRLGFTAQEVVAAMAEQSSEKLRIPRKSPQPSKVYHHPHMPGVNWNGIGRKPGWVAEFNVEPVDL